MLLTNLLMKKFKLFDQLQRSAIITSSRRRSQKKKIECYTKYKDWAFEDKAGGRVGDKSDIFRVN